MDTILLKVTLVEKFLKKRIQASSSEEKELCSYRIS